MFAPCVHCLRRFYFDLLAAREDYQKPNNTITQPHVRAHTRQTQSSCVAAAACVHAMLLVAAHTEVLFA